MRLEAHGHIDPEKPGTDLGAGISWKNDQAHVKVEAWVLDAFNDLIYVTLNASSQPQIEYTEDYQKQPFALRGFADVGLAEGVRLEAYGAWFTRSELRVTDPWDVTYDFINGEDTWYAGGLLEWKPTLKTLLSLFATNWSSDSEHVWADDDLAISNNYALSERTTQVGFFSMARLGSRWEVRAQGRRDWRPEERILTASDSTIEYALDSWLGLIGGRYQSKAGFLTEMKLSYLDSKEPLGTGQVPSAGDLTAKSVALRMGVWLEDWTQALVLHWGRARLRPR